MSAVCFGSAYFARLSTALSRFQPAVAEPTNYAMPAIIRHWIHEPNRARCSNDAFQGDCTVPEVAVAANWSSVYLTGYFTGAGSCSLDRCCSDGRGSASAGSAACCFGSGLLLRGPGSSRGQLDSDYCGYFECCTFNCHFYCWVQLFHSHPNTEAELPLSCDLNSKAAL